MIILQDILPDNETLNSITSFAFVYLPISLSLTILLTIMIIIQLALHGRNIRNALGSSADASGLYKILINMLVESYALYAVCFTVDMALTYAHNPVELVFSSILLGVQVCDAFHLI